MSCNPRPVKTRTSAGLRDYLKDAQDTAGYFRGVDGFDRVWGAGGRELGLDRGMTDAQWDELFHGCFNGEQLTRKRKDRTPVIDAMMAAPKSVAELMVAGDESTREDVREAMWIAVEAGFKYLEDNCLAVRKTVGYENGRQIQKHFKAKLIATPVMQYSARPTEQTIARGWSHGDAHLHVHVPVFTMAKLGDEWLTADSWGFLKVAQHVDQVFRGELARQLELRGYRLRCEDFEFAKNGKVGWEVEGSTKRTRRWMSTNKQREEQIADEYEAEHGKPITDVELRQRMYLTRKRKGTEGEADTFGAWKTWRETARREGVELLKVRQRGPLRHDPEHSVAELRKRLLSGNGLCRDNATFSETEVGQAIRRCAVGLGLSPEQLGMIEQSWETLLSADLLEVEASSDPDERMLTTRRVVDAEQWLRQHMDEMQAEGRMLTLESRAGAGKSASVKVLVDALRHPGPNALGAALARSDRKLDGEQVEVVRQGLAMFGPQGVDKVIVTSMANLIAEETGEKVDAEIHGSTKRLTAQLGHGLEITDRTLVVVEEAMQLDTLRADEVLRALEAKGKARYVFLGDRKQGSAIGAAGWLSEHIDRNGSLMLQHVYRQSDPGDVQAYEDLRNGHAERTVAYLLDNGRLHVTPDMPEAIKAVQQDWSNFRDAKWSAKDIMVVLDGSNADLDAVCRFVQADRVRRGEIDEACIEVHSETEGRRWKLHRGDEVITRQAHRGPKGYIANSSRGRILKVVNDSTVRVKFARGVEANMPADKVLPSYALHVARAQGTEAKIVLAVPGARTSQNTGYTMLTRAVDEAHVYCSAETHDGVDKLIDRWRTPDERMTAHRAIERYRQEELLLDLDMAAAHGERQRRPVDVMEDVPRVPEREPYRDVGREL